MLPHALPGKLSVDLRKASDQVVVEGNELLVLPLGRIEVGDRAETNRVRQTGGCGLRINCNGRRGLHLDLLGSEP